MISFFAVKVFLSAWIDRSRMLLWPFHWLRRCLCCQLAASHGEHGRSEVITKSWRASHRSLPATMTFCDVIMAPSSTRHWTLVWNGCIQAGFPRQAS